MNTLCILFRIQSALIWNEPFLILFKKRFNQQYLFTFPEPTDAGIIPPEYRRSFQGASGLSRPQLPVQPQLPASTEESLSSASSVSQSPPDKKFHQFSASPVEEWAKEQVGSKFITS